MISEIFNEFGIGLSVPLIILLPAAGGLLVAAVILWFLLAIGSYKLFLSLGVKSPYHSFMPFFRIHALGEASEKLIRERDSAKMRVLLTVFMFLRMAALAGSAVLLFLFAKNNYEDIINFVAGKPSAFDRMELYTFIDYALPVILMLIITLIFSVVFRIMKLVCLFRTYKPFAPKGAGWLTILSFVLPVSVPIIFYSLRNRKPDTDPDGWLEEEDIVDYYNELSQNEEPIPVYKDGFKVGKN